MEFLGIGYQELLLVLLLLLVVVGPERLPQMAYQIGRMVRQMQLYARAVRDEFRDEIDYLDEQYRVMRGELTAAQQTLREQEARWSAELKEIDAQVRSAGEEASRALSDGGATGGSVVPFPAAGGGTVTVEAPAPAQSSDGAKAPPLVF